MRRGKRRQIKESRTSAFAHSDRWKFFKWLWDELDGCPILDCVEDADAQHGTLEVTTKAGESFVLTLKKGTWRSI